jgi:hypothetical protein
MGAKPMACNIEALSAPERKRRAELFDWFSRAIDGVKELADGYEVALTRSSSFNDDVDELIDLERRCCSFLEFSVARAGGVTKVTITGQTGVKEFLEREFGIQPA